MRFPSLVLAALVVMACGGSVGPAAQPAEAPERPRGDVTPDMDSHFQAISDIQRLVISGDLNRSRARAQELATSLAPANHPANWRMHVDAVRRAVWTVARADNIDVAAAGTARAAYACGSCHAALGIRVVEGTPEPSVERPTDMSEYMWQHLWAADQMWSGLVGPSEDAWLRGARVLSEAGLVPQGDVELDAEMVSLAARLNISGKHALAAEGDTRATAYGDFLGSCASCHRHHLQRVD